MDDSQPTELAARSEPQAWVHEAVVELFAEVDPRAVGAAVTVALCGHWEHEGPCRWPHNNQLADGLFRTLFVGAVDEEPDVRTRIRTALIGDPSGGSYPNARGLSQTSKGGGSPAQAARHRYRVPHHRLAQ